ncbi:MAG TPA: type II secretion system protein M [Porticoccus sp.]|nr:type II secretion system protein M [Porticoccus sp.]
MKKIMTEKIKHYFYSLSEKDQKALKLLALFIAPLLLYFLIITPSFTYYTEAKTDYQESRELLAWINSNKTNISTAKSSPTTAPNLPLSQFVSTSADKNKISISRLQPQGENNVRIWLSEAEFSVLTKWLLTLTNKGLKISSITVDKTPISGVVNAQCLITNQL